MKKITGADLFIQALEEEGVEMIFGIPGEENLDLLEAIRKSRIRLIVTRHEQAAGFMAATYGRLTGKAGVCLATLGPGATNLVTPAAHAQLGAMPMVMITGQKPIKSSKQGKFQIIDVIDMMRPITKYTRQIVHAANIPSRVRQAFRIAEEERPGAVHLELPEDIAREEVEAVPFQKSEVRRPIADKVAIDRAVEMIESAERPLLLIGAGGNRKRISEMLLHFIDKTGIYFFDTQMGQGVLDGRHPCYLGNAALSQDDFIHCAINKADLIINVGHDVVEKPPFFMHGDEQKVIHVNFSSAYVDPVYFPQAEVVGDISNSIRMMGEQISVQPGWDFAYYRKIKTELDNHLKLQTDDSRFPMIPQRIVADTRQAVPKDGIISLDNGIYKIWFSRNYPVYERNTLLLDNALASMGAGLPAAIACKLIHPERKAVAVCGDGGFMMNSQEMETAVRLGIDLVVVILRDDAYGMIKWKQADMKYENFGLDFKNPDFVSYAQSYGASGHRIQSAEEFLPKLTECLNSKGVHLIDVLIDYSENEKVLTEQMRQRTCTL